MDAVPFSRETQQAVGSYVTGRSAQHETRREITWKEESIEKVSYVGPFWEALCQNLQKRAHWNYEELQ
jgi:hypothetical protein